MISTQKRADWEVLCEHTESRCVEAFTDCAPCWVPSAYFLARPGFCAWVTFLVLRVSCTFSLKIEHFRF